MFSYKVGDKVTMYAYWNNDTFYKDEEIPYKGEVGTVIDNKGSFLTVDFGVVIEGISVYLLQYNEVEAVVMCEEEWRQNNGC